MCVDVRCWSESPLYGALCLVSLHGQLRFCGDASQRSHHAVVHVFKDPDDGHEHQDAVPFCAATCFEKISVCSYVEHVPPHLLPLSCVCESCCRVYTSTACRMITWRI
eukprot:Blabericola_migrator_1__9435@NODE_5109_length_871_cov_53_427861_g3241_i0_p1_GENE_NODE_5109_length_871_cov_53_427861_g3241_i0NODE_5109_length_871_cov_53_427861_g3241_i0_p1_ORF_typecomplete_len108_score3_69_NODE_5109_length_871_cov_53_427861_g3241_i0428751